MKILKILFVLFFLTSTNFAQVDKDKFYFSIWKNPPHSNSDLIVSFSACYNLFVFEKISNNTFSTNFSVQIEIFDSTFNLQKRDFIDANVVCATYEQTISKELYYSNSFYLKLSPDSYIGKLTLFNKNKTIEIDAGSFKFSLINKYEIIPIVINEKDLSNLQKDSESVPFTNFVTFNSEKQLLLIPYFSDIQEFKVIFRDSVIDLSQKTVKGLDYLYVSLADLPLIDESYIVKLKADGREIEFPLKVVWLNKPFTLKNFDFALQLLSYIFDNSVISKINKAPQNRSYYLFFDAWKKLDPTPNTAFNELLNEFYSRADLAVDKFKSLTQPNGALTDRGKIFILYGNPANIDRKFNSAGKAVEIWYYKNNVKHQFTFIDETKNGNFILKK